MTWISPDAWLDALGGAGADLARPYAALGGEDDLAAAIAEDPRRLVALVGDEGSNASRLALLLARRAPIAFYRDPRVAPDPIAEVDALERLLASVPPAPRPLVVLDGPVEGEALASLARLLARRVHPRLAVVVPCRPSLAPRLSRVAGGYSRASILVASVGGAGDPGAAWAAVADPGALPLVLAGRVPRGVVRAESKLVAAGVAARAPDGESLVVLAGERSREASARAAILDAPDGGARLAQVLAAHPVLRAAITESLLRWTAGAIPEPLLGALAGFGVEDAPDVREYARKGVFVSAEFVASCIERLRALQGSASGDDADALAEKLAGFVDMRDHEEATSLLRVVASRTPSAATRARVKGRIAGATRDLALAGEVVAEARALGDPRALAAALLQWALLLEANDLATEARAAAEEAAELEAGAGMLAAAASARGQAAKLAEATGDLAGADLLAQRALGELEAIGDTRAQLFALYRAARLRVELREDERAADAIGAALSLATAVVDVAGIAYCHYVLGALADRRGDPAAAAKHYTMSIEAYVAVGSVPERLLPALEQARTAAEGVARQRGEHDVEPAPALPPVPLEDAPAPPQLVQLRRAAEEA